MKVKWLPVSGYEGLYEVSSSGLVRSLDRVVGGRWGDRSRTLPGRVLRLRKEKKEHGRKTVILYDGSGKTKTKRVHRLVLEAFVGPCPSGMEGCHNDGNPANNKLNNLRWDTRSANHMDRVKHGTHDRGERNPMAKIIPEKVIAIRTLYKKTEASQHDLADLFDLSQAHISRIVNMKRWAYLEIV